MKKINIYSQILIISLLTMNTLNLRAETLEDIGKELGEIREQISNLKTSNVKEAIKIDSALTELDQVVEFVEKSVSKGDIETAISTINIAETTIGDISKSLPSEFETIKIKSGKEFGDQEMKEISKITKGLNENKKIKKKKIIKDLDIVKAKGLDIEKISINITASGIQSSLINEKVKKNIIKKSNLEKEFSDQEKYGAIIGTTPEKVSVAMRQVNVIQSGNPKDHRALEIEKYGLEAGLSKAQIKKGIKAVYSGNIKVETQITKKIYSKLSQNKNWVVESADIDNMMQQNIAVEKAANAILNSGIDFGKGTNSKAVKILSDQVANLLTGTTDQKTIDKITYKIERTQYEIWENPNAVAANMIAEIAGPDQVNALVSVRNDQKFGITDSLVEQAARVEANINGDIDSFIDAGKGSLGTIELSSSDKKKLTSVYNEAISDGTLSASNSNLAGELKSAASLAAESQAKDLKKAEDIINQNNLTSKAFEKFINTKYEGDGSAWKSARKEYLDAFQLNEKIRVQNNMSFDAATKAIEAAGNISSSLGNTAKTAASEISNNVSESVNEITSNVSSSVTETAQEVAQEVAQEAAQDVAKEVAQEIAEEVNKEVAKDIAKEVKEEVGKSLADLKAEERAAWEEYSKDGWNMEKRQKHLDAAEAVRQKQREEAGQ